MRIRKANEIDYEYISSVLKNGSYNIDNIIIHSVIEKNDSVKYAIEVHHEERITLFTASKSEIDNKVLERNYFTKDEVCNLIKKIINDCKVLKKYNSNYKGFLHIDEFAFVIKPNGLFATCAIKEKDYKFYTNSKSFLAFNSIINVEIDSGANHSNVDRIYADGMRLSHDSDLYSYKVEKNLAIEYFKNPDYFAVSTISEITKDSYDSLCEIYSVLEEIKHLQYKIRTGEHQIGDDDTSYYRKIIKKYMKLDLEEVILKEIETQYADHIKIP